MFEGTDMQVRFSEVVKDELYKARISKAEVDDAIVLSRGIKNDTPCHYVGNLKINHYLKELSSKIFSYDFFEFYDTKSETWRKVCATSSSIINEIMLNPRYIQSSDNFDYDYYACEIELIINKEKFIADRVAQYFSTTINILIKELYSKKSSEEKIENLQAIVSPDYLLSDDHIQDIKHLT